MGIVICQLFVVRCGKEMDANDADALNGDHFYDSNAFVFFIRHLKQLNFSISTDHGRLTTDNGAPVRKLFKKTKLQYTRIHRSSIILPAFF
jgi:hypothetical protein